MLRLDLFGTLRLWRDDSPLELATPPKTLHLLAYLLIHRHTSLTRNQVAFALRPDRRRIAFCLEGLGQSVSEADPEQAVRWLSAAQALRQEISAPLPPSEQDLFQRALDRLTARFGAETLEALWQRAQSLPLDEVVMPLLNGTHQPGVSDHSMH